MKVPFLSEAKHRMGEKKPPFFKKLQRISALVIGTGLSVAFVPGALIYGLITIGIGLGAGITAELTTRDTAERVTEKVAHKIIEKELEDSTKTQL